jgi:hypothetical protein
VREKERVMCRDRAGKWKLAEIVDIREFREEDEDLSIEEPISKRFKTESNPEESKKEAEN